MSFKYAEQAFDLAEKSCTDKEIAAALFTLATINYHRGLIEISIRQYSKCLDIAQELRDTKRVASVMVNLGDIPEHGEFSTIKEKFRAGAENISTVIHSATKKDFSTEIITIYNNLGIVNQNLGNHNQALEFYSMGIAMARHTPDVSDKLAMLLNNLGSENIDVGKLSEAFPAISEGMEIRSRNNDLTGQAQSCRMFARYYSLLKDKEKTLEFLNKGFKLSESVGNSYLIAAFADKLYQMYNDAHQSDSALKYHVF